MKVGKVQGFKPTTEKNTIRCNRFGSKKYARKYEGEGFRLAATLYYASNQCTPSNDPFKIKINLPKKYLSAACIGRDKHALSLNQIRLDRIHLGGNMVVSVVLPPRIKSWKMNAVVSTLNTFFHIKKIVFCMMVKTKRLANSSIKFFDSTYLVKEEGYNI